MKKKFVYEILRDSQNDTGGQVTVSLKAESYKKNEREMWNQFSRRYTDVVLPEFRPFGRRLIELAAIRPGMWVLDVATGPGEPALTIARRVGPRGLVAGVDFSPTMLRQARARARALGVRNVQFHEMDAERLTFADLTFDRVVCRFGLMLMPAAERALADMRSEEHTSELQSQSNLVCRLLLEKKKKKKKRK